MNNQYNTEVINVSTTGSDVLVFTATASTTLLKNIYWYSSSSASVQFKLKKNGGSVTEVSSFVAAASKQTPLYASLIALEANDEVYLQSDTAGTLNIIYVQNSASLAGQSINILVDVDTNGKTTGDVLTYNGTEWVAQAFTGSSTLNLSVGSVDFDLSSPPSLADGRLAYDLDRETLIFQSEHGELAIGEGYKPVTNNTGSAIPKGSVVKATGVSGEKFTIDLFDASASVGEELYFIGVTQAQINDQADGIVVSEGYVKHLNTNSYPIGTILYASETAGELTSTKPTSPNLGIAVAMVTKRDLSNGTIYVRASTYSHLEEIHDVYIDTLGQDDILAYDATRGAWTNVSDIKVDSVETGIVKSTGDVLIKLDTDNNTTDSSFKVQDGAGGDVFVINESGIASYDANADAVFKTGKLTNISGDWNGISLNGNLAYPGIQGIAGGDDIVSTMIIASEVIDIRPDLSSPVAGGLRINHDGTGDALVTINKGSTPPTTHNLYVGGNAKFDSTIDALGAVIGTTGILSTGNIQTTGTLSGSGLNISGSVSFGQITSSVGVLTPSVTFTNDGQSIIGVGGLGPDDLTIKSNGNVTVELDADNNETSQKFAVNDPSTTERFSVSDTGVVTINSAFSLPTSDGTSGQTLQTNGTGTVTWVTPSSGGASDLINDTTPQLGGDLDVNGKYLDLTQNTAGTLLVTGDQYAFRFRSGTSGAPANTGLYFSVTNGAYEFLNGNSVPIFQIKAGTGETKIANAFTLPITDGSANQVLQTDGSGNVDWATLDTDDIPEGTSNLYWTQSRFDGGIAGITSDDIADGTTTVIMTTAERTKLSGIAAGAEVNVNADWNAVSGDAQILNKPTLATVATSGAYADLSGLPTIPDELADLAGTADDITEGQTNLFLTSAERTAIANIPNEFFTVSSNANTAITLASGDEGKYIRTTAATAVTVTIPSSVFSTGDEILIEQAGAGQVTVAAGTGVTLNNSASNTAKTAEQYAVVGLKCVASNVFTLTGERELV